MNRTSISDLKSKAKDQLLGNYKIATGTFALLFVLLYAIMSIVVSAFSAFRTMPEAVLQLLSVIVASISTVFTVGYIYILKKIKDGDRPVVADLLYAFHNHPDKILIISLILGACRYILLLPSTFIQKSVFTEGDPTAVNGKAFLMWVLAYLTGTIISIVIEFMLAMCYMIYLDDPEIPVLSCMSESVSMMKGNKFRYFYMILSFIGYWLLVILSVGIGALFVAPFQMMTMLEFYDDLKGDEVVYERGI